MTLSRSRRIAVLAGLSVFAVVLPLVLNWRSVYYAIYPRERLYGRWTQVAQTAETPNPAAQQIVVELTAVEFLREGVVHVDCRVRSAPVAEGGIVIHPSFQRLTVSRDCRAHAAPRHCVTFPKLTRLPVFRSADDAEGDEKHPPVQVRFRFDSDGRLILEHDAPFLSDGGKKLILERAPEVAQSSR